MEGGREKRGGGEITKEKQGGDRKWMNDRWRYRFINSEMKREMKRMKNRPPCSAILN